MGEPIGLDHTGAPPMTPWTEERITRLKILWREGRTAEAIARELGDGVSRSAVLGKVHRLKLAATRAPRRPPAKLELAATYRNRRSMVPAAPVWAPSMDAGADAPQSGSRSILTIRPMECRWPFGEPGQTGFSLCGRRVARGAFCAGHAAVAYRGAPLGAEGLLTLAGVS